METPAEELGRLRRELSEMDHEWPEYGMILDRIAVLVREAAERRRAERRSQKRALERAVKKEARFW
jgi:hypothetical protein